MMKQRGCPLRWRACAPKKGRGGLRRRPCLVGMILLLVLCVLAFAVGAGSVKITDKNGNVYYFHDCPPCAEWGLAGGTDCEDIIAIFHGPEGSLTRLSDAVGTLCIEIQDLVISANRYDPRGNLVASELLADLNELRPEGLVGITAEFLRGSTETPVHDDSGQFSGSPVILVLDVFHVDPGDLRVSGRSIRCFDITHLVGPKGEG